MARTAPTKRAITRAAKLQAAPLPAWTPFEQAVTGRYAGGRSRAQVVDELLARTDGFTREEIEEQLRDLAEETIYLNSRYQVNVREIGASNPQAPRLIHLSIKRLDKAPLGAEHFRDLQRIKNELVGPECEGVEVYPAESRLVDTSNQYHVWVFADPTFRLPWGFSGRFVTDVPIAGSVQQPFEET